MALLRRLPPRLGLTCSLLGLLLAVLTAMRVAFWLLFRATDSPIPAADVWYSFYIGFKLDLRLCLLAILPVLLLSRIPALNPFRSAGARRFWAGHVAALATLIVFFCFVDLAHYAYLGERLDVAALRFLRNPIISLEFVWETYPILRGLGALAVLAFILHRCAAWLIGSCAKGAPPSRRGAILTVALIVFVYAAGLYGKASYYPLRWSDAYFSPHRFSSALALNPVLFFVDTVCTAEDAEYDRDETAKHYDRMAAYLGVDAPDPDTLSFARRVRPVGKVGDRPNVVVILLESFAAHKTGAFGNPLDPSPHFDAIAKDALLYRRFYTPGFGTARAVFATVTGIPDTVTHRTASRNPRVLDQHTVMGSLGGYEKFYFLGGSASWANIRGLLSHNVSGIRIFEEGSYEAPRGDVWGVSDLILLETANRVFREQDGRPFFALLHLSGNHRPYTIPEDTRGFAVRSVPPDRLRENGFQSVEEFNSFRFMDHSLGFFFQAAKQEAYFRNTVFMMFGDNGTSERNTHMPESEHALGLDSFHTPFAIYGPHLIPRGASIDLPASQVDVMPTVAGLIGAPVVNTTMGRNLRDPRFDGRRYAFTVGKHGAETEVGLFGEGFYLVQSPDGKRVRLHAVDAEDPAEDVGAKFPGRAKEMSAQAQAIYHTSKYMLYNNASSRVGGGK